MKTIETKYHGPTDRRGSRISATDCGDHRIFISYNHALNADKNHAAAALKLCEKLGWGIRMIGGQTKAGMVWVFPEGAPEIVPTLSGYKPAARRPYQPTTGKSCACKPGVERDNCAACEGTGMQIDFSAIRAR